MFIVVPNIPEFRKNFSAIDSPLLHELNYFHLSELSLEEAAVIRTAWDTWADLNLRLPAAFRDGADASARETPIGEKGLLGDDFPLHVVDFDAEALGLLVEFYELLKSPSETARQALEDLGEPDAGIVANVGRILDMLKIPTPARLVESWVESGLQEVSAAQIFEEYPEFARDYLSALKALEAR